MYWSIYCYYTNPGSQATYHDSQKIAFSLLQKWIRTVEYGIVVIKKASVKTLQIGLYSVFSNVPIKHTRKRNLIVKEKGHSFISTSLQLQYWKNNKDFLCQLCLLSLYLFWLTPCIFDLFYLWITSWSWTDKSETLEKFCKHQSLWWKHCVG